MPIGPASRLMPTLRRVALAGATGERTDGQLLGAFVADRDADAFAALVRRHGPMVLGVCRRVTGDHATAEDAFQAVFLVLARRAAAVKPREQVGNWLYGVAYRTAMKARAVLARRRSREKQVDVMPEQPVTPHEVWSDLQPLIDEELARLPDKLRVPVVLCDLEGRPQREVARQLGVPAATLATRLATARRSLARSLTRRGVTLSGGALAGLLTAHGTAAAVPHKVAYALAQAADAGGNVAASRVSPHAIQLSEGVIRMMLLTKLKALAVAVLAAAGLTGGLGLGLAPAAAGDEPARTPGANPAPAATPAAPGKDKTVKVVKVELRLNGELNDETFLRRLILDLCGVPPTEMELRYFTADADNEKRAKVIKWLTQDETVRARLAKALGVPPEQVQVVRVRTAGDGKPVTLAIVSSAGPHENTGGFFTYYGRQNVTKSQPAEVAYFLSTQANGGDVRQWDVVTTKRLVLQAQPSEPGAGGKGSASPPAAKTEQPVFVDPMTVTKDVVIKLDGNVVNAAEDTPLKLVAQLDDVWQVDVLANDVWATVDVVGNVDAEFLKRVLTESRGTPPTPLEEKYFAEDKDPKKREKVLDTLLKDPAVARKLGEGWKKKMLEAAPATATLDARLFNYRAAEQHFEVIPVQPAPRITKVIMRFSTDSSPHKKLVDELLAAKKSDTEVLEALTLAVLGRLPTDAEKKLTLGLVARASDRAGAWVEVATALASIEEAAKRKAK
jgi:RNA polymerase sigma factor (sigma-70 family)